MKRHYNNITAVLIILFLGILFQKNYINEFPTNKHAWAQSDRYALAHGFLNNNLNFFKPETFVLNHQFPDSMKVPSKESITAVDFPIHDYIPAIFMKISGVKSSWIFQTYILLYSFIGFFFLFKLSFLITNDFLKSVFVLLFASTSPVYVYYQGGFLPTIPSLSNAVIGLYFYILYLKNSENKYFSFSILFLTLATLSRTSFAIPLLSILAVEFLKFLKYNSELKPKFIPVTLSLVIIIFFYFYNGYLRNNYGSMFLNHFLPAKNIQQALEIFSVVKEKWLFQYFTKLHYGLFILLLLYFAFLFVLKKTKRNDFIITILLLNGIMFFGCILFAVLMLRQFPAHDYYFLDTFFFPILLFLILTLSKIPLKQNHKTTAIIAALIMLISIPLILNAYNSQKSRRETAYWDRTTATINNYTGSSVFLDSLNISRKAKILAIDAYAPNIPFMLMERKGYALMSTKKENIKNALGWEYDYITIQNEFFLSDIYSEYPEILKRIYKVADNGKISLCKFSNNVLNQSLFDFIGLSDKVPVFKSIMTYDTIADESWQNTAATEDYFFSGNKAGVLKDNMIFGITYKTKDLPIITKKNCLLYVSSYFLHEGIDDCEIVVSIKSNGQKIYFKSINLRNILKQKTVWENVNLMFQLPIVNSDNYEFAVYIRNTGKTELYIDDFEFKLYE